MQEDTKKQCAQERRIQNAKYLIALALAIPIHRMVKYLPMSNQRLLGVSNNY